MKLYPALTFSSHPAGYCRHKAPQQEEHRLRPPRRRGGGSEGVKCKEQDGWGSCAVGRLRRRGTPRTACPPAACRAGAVRKLNCRGEIIEEKRKEENDREDRVRDKYVREIQRYIVLGGVGTKQ